MRELRVVFIPPGEPARDEVIRDGLKDMQRLVGGLIESVYAPGLPPGVMFFGNDEARMLGMPWNVLTDAQPLAGPLFAVGYTEDGESRSLTPTEREQILRFVERRRLKGKSFMPPGVAFTMDLEEGERSAYLDAAWLSVQQHLGVEDMERIGELPGFENGEAKRLIDSVITFIKTHRAMPGYADFIGLYAGAASN